MFCNEDSCANLAPCTAHQKASTPLSLGQQISANLLLGNRLRPTTTRVRNRDGTVFEEKKDQSGNLVTTYVGKEVLPSFLTDASKGLSKLSSFEFSADYGWFPAAPSAASLPDVISLVTYNVWFKEYYAQERADALFQLLQGLEPRPHAIAFQEVTPFFQSRVATNEWVRENYYISDANGLTVVPYGVMMLVSKTLPCPIFQLHALPSNMGRRFLQAIFLPEASDWNTDAPASALAIGTAHFESRDNTQMRVAQLGIAYPLLKCSQTAILMGDTNYPHGAVAETAVLNEHKGFADVWVQLNPGKEAVSTGLGMDRIDKVFLKSEVYSPVSQTLLGNQPFRKDLAEPDNEMGPHLYPSDHFGLHTIIARR